MNATVRHVVSTAVLLGIAVLIVLVSRRSRSGPARPPDTNSLTLSVAAPTPQPIVERIPYSRPTPNEGGLPAEEIVGIGIVLFKDQKSQKLMVRGVITGSPADKAGLTEGLVLHTIDGMSTIGLQLKDCVERVRGPAGSVVQLGLLDPAGGETNMVELTREKIQLGD